MPWTNGTTKTSSSTGLFYVKPATKNILLCAPQVRPSCVAPHHCGVQGTQKVLPPMHNVGSVHVVVRWAGHAPRRA